MNANIFHCKPTSFWRELQMHANVVIVQNLRYFLKSLYDIHVVVGNSRCCSNSAFLHLCSKSQTNNDI